MASESDDEVDPGKDAEEKDPDVYMDSSSLSDESSNQGKPLIQQEDEWQQIREKESYV